MKTYQLDSAGIDQLIQDYTRRWVPCQSDKCYHPGTRSRAFYVHKGKNLCKSCYEEALEVSKVAKRYKEIYQK